MDSKGYLYSVDESGKIRKIGDMSFEDTGVSLNEGNRKERRERAALLRIYERQLAKAAEKAK